MRAFLYTCTLGQFVPKQPAPAVDLRRSSVLFTHPHMNRMEEIQMTTINLKDFYAWYTHDEYIEVSDEVAAELMLCKESPPLPWRSPSH